VPGVHSSVSLITPVEVHIQEFPVDELDSAWVQQVDSELKAQGARLTSMEDRMEGMEASLQLNTEATFEIHDILTAAKGAFRTLGWLGTGAAWLMKLGAAVVALYAAAKTYFPHWFPK
jgi:hypothetical protein